MQSESPMVGWAWDHLRRSADQRLSECGIEATGDNRLKLLTATGASGAMTIETVVMSASAIQEMDAGAVASAMR